MFGKPSPKAIAIIPARLGSTRFPRKALADDTGKPMVVHVCEQASKAESVDPVVVATDAEEIKAAVEAHGFEAVMTSVEHTNGTSRLAEAASILKLNQSQIVVNVQGDEPEIEPEVIDGAVRAACAQRVVRANPEMGSLTPALGTVITPLSSVSDIENPNVVKAVIGMIHPDSESAQALYFSRAAVPFDRSDSGNTLYYRHVGIYAYSVASLNTYLTLDATPLELAESLEQLRWLEHGYHIEAAICDSMQAGIDTPEQYRSFVERFSSTQS